jgi:hypothetical protein
MTIALALNRPALKPSPETLRHFLMFLFSVEMAGKYQHELIN